ncbi:Uncharacterized protein LOCC1_G003652 [Lachnellula occidentalis]|uniref:Cobalamin-independent methionine synthase MetE C-terminal/archaeal domain-containing protein n=1 Tax=Lachnellula occidentalis TaxID=215460 RepID=A0A8H8S3U3_9HELO|nr:Uncharacterized protein LOCC1_G003652 [Lachnellula occidentalis]
MTTYRNPPFQAEHLGSLLRPKEFLEKRAAFEKKGLSQEDIIKAEDEAITKVVDVQTEIGFRAVSDGEYRRAVFWGTFFEELEGMTEIRNPSMDIFRPYVPDIAGFIEKGHKPGQSGLCTGKIRHKGESTLVGQFEFLKTLIPKERWGDIKLTMIAPPWYHLRYKDDLAYPKDLEYGTSKSMIPILLVSILQSGNKNVHLHLPDFCSEQMLAGWAEDKSNTKTPDETLDAYIKCYNDSIADHSDKMHFGLHICRGNFMGSRHFSEGGYDRIATKLFQTLNVATYYLEYDTPRAGGFEPLLHLPSHKNAILGVVTSKFPALEVKEEMKERIFAAADVMARGAGQTRDEALKRIGVSPQCGFASHEEGNLLGWEDMKNKLMLVRSIADDIWPGEP